MDVYKELFKNLAIAAYCLTRLLNRGCSVTKDVLKNFPNFTGKHLCWSLLL